MLFNSYVFILIFLPIVLAGYFLLHLHTSAKWAHRFLLAASLGFMSFWNIYFALVLIGSVVFNYGFGSALAAFSANGKKASRRKALFGAAIAANIVYLGFFKYYNFFLDNINSLFSTHIGALHILLPLGISFYTFMQMIWLTDIYRHGRYRYGFFQYCLYVTFFPYVVSGPIAYHTEVIPQISSEAAGRFNIDNVCRGLFLFSIGLFKKTAIADTLAMVADGGFSAAGTLTFTEAWLTSLSYTMQLYFDFSGYTDMAIGVALMFNIRLPINFDSPYKSLSIRDFWRRWHITLSRFLREYIYIPLGGNRFGECRTLANLMITFLIAGLWHGAAWLFVFWGFLHGATLCLHRLWMKTGLKLNRVVAWLLTFHFINIAWVFFRASNWDNAVNIIKGMFGLNGIVVSSKLADSPFWQNMTSLGIRFGNWRENLPELAPYHYFLCVALILVVALAKNSHTLARNYVPGWKTDLAIGLMMAVGLLLLNQPKTFLYFNF